MYYTAGSACLHHTVTGLVDHPRLLRSHCPGQPSPIVLLASVEGRVMKGPGGIPWEFPPLKTALCTCFSPNMELTSISGSALLC